MNLIWLLLRASWMSVALAIFTGLISGASSARLIALINHAINGYIDNDNLFWHFLELALLALFSGILSQVLLVKLAQHAVYNLRIKLSKGILAAALQHTEELGVSRLMATLTEDVQTLSHTVFVVPFIFIDVAIITGCFVYLTWLSATVFGLALVVIVLAIASTQVLLNKAQKFLFFAREEQDNLFKHFRSITEGIKELKLNTFRRQAFFEQELLLSAAASRKYNIAAHNTFAISTSWGNLLFFTIIGLLLFGLPRMVPTSSSILSAYVLTITYLTTPCQNILERLPALFQANVALQKVEKMGLALASQKEDTTLLQPINSASAILKLEEVTHNYRGEEDTQFTLGPISLTFYPSELVFIVGGNGSGKSTLAKIITGLYIPKTGKIKLNNNLIEDHNREWYRQHFSAIFSDFYLFDRLLGVKGDTQKYLQLLQLNHKVQIEGSILSTTALSQGQRKRLALLTAYLEDRPIYLFDEWASDQDPSFREIFYKQLLPELKQRGKTVLVITHDDHYFYLADRIIKLDYGKVEFDN